MKRIIVAFLVIVILFTTSTAHAEGFNISVFTDNPEFEVDIDEMDDTGEIRLAEGCTIHDSTENTLFLGGFDIRMIDDELPPIIRLGCTYYSKERINIDSFIVKTEERRYTFSGIDADIEEGALVMESFVLGFTPDSIQMIDDIINSESDSIRYRIDGDKRVDGFFTFDRDNLKKLYSAYIESRALDNDFSLFEMIFPCDIK